MIYGKVKYVGELPYFVTRGYEAPLDEPNPEGGFIYEFDPRVYIRPIQTRLDLDYFVQHPDLYEVELPSGKPVRKVAKDEAKAPEPRATVSFPSNAPGSKKVKE